MVIASRDYAVVVKVMSVRRERKYMMIRYLKAGYSLEDAKRKSIVVATASTNEYMNGKDKRDLLSLEGGLHHLTQTRAQATEKLRVRFAPRSGFARREEAVASLMTAFRIPTPLDYTREPALRGKGKPAPPRRGSSKGKIGRTRVIGADKTLLQLRALFRQLRRLGKGKGVTRKQRTQIANSIKASVSENNP